MFPPLSAAALRERSARGTLSPVAVLADRDTTSAEQLAGDQRQAFTPAKLAKLFDWAKKLAARGYTPIQPGPEQRTAAAWSKWLNRYLNAKVSDDPQLALCSLGHSFRQMLRAGNIGDELPDKIFGHSTGKVGAGCGRDLSPAEAQLFIASVKLPVCLQRLWRLP